jgi:hypothetical protein
VKRLVVLATAILLLSVVVAESGPKEWTFGDPDIVESLNGHQLQRAVDSRWQELFELTRDNDFYDHMKPLEVFEWVFGESPDMDNMHVPDRRDCESITWGELKVCFDGEGTPSDGGDGNGNGSEPPEEDDPPDDPGDGE